MMECLPRWTTHRVEPFGLDISEDLVARARERLPEWSDRLFVGNALSWQSGQRFDFIRTNVDYVPPHRRRQLIENLLAQAGRLIVGVFNEQTSERPTEEMMRDWGYRIAGRSERANLKKPEIDYRVFWIDSEERG
jgi:trans-aconitate methyltransferase